MEEDAHPLGLASARLAEEAEAAPSRVLPVAFHSPGMDSTPPFLQFLVGLLDSRALDSVPPVAGLRPDRHMFARAA